MYIKVTANFIMNFFVETFVVEILIPLRHISKYIYFYLVHSREQRRVLYANTRLIMSDNGNVFLQFN